MRTKKKKEIKSRDDRVQAARFQMKPNCAGEMSTDAQVGRRLLFAMALDERSSRTRLVLRAPKIMIS